MSDIFENFADLEGLADELRSSDPKRRRVAVIELGDSGEPGAIPLLAGLSKDLDAGVRRQAAIALGSFDGREAAAALVVALVDADHDVAAAASESLPELKDSKAAGPIIPLVDHASPFVRASALRALKELRNGDSLGPALNALRDSDPHVRVQAVGVIGYLKREETLPALRHAAVTDSDPGVRRVAINAIEFSRSHAAAETIAAGLSDKDWSVRQAAADALSSTTVAKSYADLLIDTINDEFWQVSLSAIRSLGKLEIDRAAALIAPYLKHEQPNVRKETAIALGSIRAIGSRPFLLAAADDTDADVRKNVRWALERLNAGQQGE